MNRRVVVTGLGAVSPIGIGRDEFWRRLTAGESGLGPIRRFDAGGFACQIAGEVSPFKIADFVPPSYRKATKMMARDIQLAVIAARTAFDDARLATRATDPDTHADDNRFSCHLGAGLISVDLDELTAALHASRAGDRLDLGRWGSGGMAQLTPLWLLKYLPNMLASHISIIYGLTGASNTITATETSGHLAIGEAFRTIARGDADRAICGGIESKVNPLGQARQSLLRRLNGESNADPGAAVRPFAEDARGTILGEGGGLLNLEERESAQQRGAPIYAELVGFGSSQTPQVSVESEPSGDSYSLAVQAALDDAGVAPSAVDMLIPGAMGIASHDRAELAALASVFGEGLSRLPLAPIKAQTGNLMAGGSLEAVATVLALHHQMIPPARNADSAARPGGLNVAPVARPAALEVAACSTTGLGGQAGVLIFKRFSPD
jgi:3-oxoacyl-[acyl-carrier-protein] synthase II